MVAATTRLATMANIAPAFAVRAAADAGIFTAIDDGVTTPGPLADITGFARSRLVRFMRYLAAMNLVTIGNESSGSSQRTSSDNNNNQTTVDHATPEGQLVYGLTPLGMELADPHSPASGYLSGFGAMQALSFIHLGEGLRTGKPVGLGADGRTLAHCTNTNPGLAHGLAAGANLRMGWLAPAVATGLDLSGTSTAMVIGPGAAVLADELTRTNPSLTVTIVDHPDRKQLNLAEISDTRRPRISTAESISDADVVIIHDPWGEDIPTPEVDDSASRAHLTNGAPGSVASDGADPAGDAPAVFSALPDSVSTVVVVTQILLDDGTGDNADYEADLQRMLVSGTSIPTERDVHTALCNAGFVIENRQPVGWGPIRFIARRVG